ncbi:MAG TPA: SHOCT domain-containing protein [Nocardioidaceae bacterium]|nr:SHOCT domain-containing protein [Nocardioidaceae bacterium]
MAYLMVLFSILTDLFRDRDTSGWAKAGWIIFLIVFPFITALVYLIARGKGMTERSVRQAEAVKTQQDAYIREVAAKATPADQIAQARAMLDAGTITQTEYERLKEKALV